jgi:biopolymer transport protein ExbB
MTDAAQAAAAGVTAANDPARPASELGSSPDPQAPSASAVEPASSSAPSQANGAQADPAQASSLQANALGANQGASPPVTDAAPMTETLAAVDTPMPDVAPDLAIDPALGAGIEAIATPSADAAGSLFGQGGPVLFVLALLSMAALSILLVKLWQFARLQLNASEPVGQALSLWYQHKPGQAIMALQGSPQPTARLLERALGALATPGVDLALLREELVRFASAQLEALRAWLRALEIIAALSPLLGLLGTVLGMIQAFRQLELAGNQVDPAILSGGIWQALLTTAAGLAVAIPVVLLHSWLERRVERCGHQMEDAVTRVFTRDLVSAGQIQSETHLNRAESVSPRGSVRVAKPPSTDDAT